MSEFVVTREGLDRLQAELERLTTVERRSIADRLSHAAAAESNRAENADYSDAREQQALLERRIARLQQWLGNARVVEPRLGNGRVDVGERVHVQDLTSGDRLELELVGAPESDPNAGRISVVSPVGKAIVGLQRGQVVEVETPLGGRRFKVLEVEPPERAA
ncbi:MAG TPA: transcription elongation factor GreA [Gaiellaceae bacterium]|nr:transcription elongation factor GreA [Gaiellaceae bacterium]